MRALVTSPSRRDARHIVGIILRAGAVAIFLAAILASQARAQEPGLRTLELNAFGRYTDFAPAIGLQSGVGGGLRVGYFVLPRWQLEAGAGYARVDRVSGTEAASVIPILFDVTYNVPLGLHELLLGGGAVYNSYGPSHAWGTSVTAGVRLAFGTTAALRVDGTREYMNTRDDVPRHSNWGFRLGLSWMLAQREVRENVAIDQREVLERPPLRLDRAADPVLLAHVAVVEMREGVGLTIPFNVGSATVRRDATTALEAKLDFLRGMPALRIRIEGQADSRGATADDITLAWARAGAAKLWLTAHGIDATRIDIIGFGAGRPVCDDSGRTCPWPKHGEEFVIIAGADIAVPGSR